MKEAGTREQGAGQERQQPRPMDANPESAEPVSRCSQRIVATRNTGTLAAVSSPGRVCHHGIRNLRRQATRPVRQITDAGT